MTQDEISNKLWDLRNQAWAIVQEANSNRSHSDYKSDWLQTGKLLQFVGKQIEQLSENINRS